MGRKKEIEEALAEFKTVEIVSSEDEGQIVFVGESTTGSGTIFLAAADKTSGEVAAVMISPEDAREVAEALIKLAGDEDDE